MAIFIGHLQSSLYFNPKICIFDLTDLYFRVTGMAGLTLVKTNPLYVLKITFVFSKVRLLRGVLRISA